MLNVIIRQVAEADICVVEDISVAGFAVHYDYYRNIMGDKIFETVHKDWREKKKKAVRDACLSGTGYKAYIAEVDDKPAGFITFITNPVSKIGVISNNSVSPDYQGQGIGKKLYEFALNIMKKEGMVCARVDTGLGPTFEPARRAYEKSGFDRQLQTVSYYMEL